MTSNWRAISKASAALAVLLLLLAACSQPPAPVVMGGSNTKSTAVPPRPLVKPESQIAVNSDDAMVPLPRTKPAPSRESADEASSDLGAVQVQAGDTVYALSRRHHVGVRDIIRANRLEPPYKLAIGQSIRLPRAQYHVVRAGETLYGLSENYDVDMSAMVRANNIPAPYRLVVGQRLRLPGASAKVAQDIPPAAVQTAAAAPRKQVRKGIPGKPPPLAGKYFLWPAEGALLSSFGPKEGGLHNDGINFSVPRGAPLRAAENGIVAYAGNELPGYGNLLLIRHDGGWMSAYAHNDTLLVSRGDEVKRGQIVSHAGSTGNVASPQAHFELRRNGKPVNPEKYLAKS
ncbi:MAG: peptidoglycan DD-metalloendopeptidase family protein [Proteobacteria bacterium]|nr:peptidoglycan DD-metalloendopeptidase family protein [Pseudomonadota bacterium]MDA1356721.1 peptidoglycan DD-metalloendopeptidase family protein [Pseudomonadota bacterium]